ENDEHRRRDIQEYRQYEHQKAQGQSGLICHRLLPQLGNGIEYEHADTDTYTGKSLLHCGYMGEAGEYAGNEGDDHQGGEDYPQSGDDASRYTLSLLTYKGGGVHGNY